MKEVLIVAMCVMLQALLFKSKYDPQIIYLLLFYTDHTDFTD